MPTLLEGHGLCNSYAGSFTCRLRLVDGLFFDGLVHVFPSQGTPGRRSLPNHESLTYLGWILKFLLPLCSWESQLHDKLPHPHQLLHLPGFMILKLVGLTCKYYMLILFPVLLTLSRKKSK